MLPEKLSWITEGFEPEGDPWLLLQIARDLLCHVRKATTRPLPQVHAEQELFVGLRALHAVDEQFHRFHRIHVVEHATQNPHAAEFVFVHQQLFAACA